MPISDRDYYKTPPTSSQSSSSKQTSSGSGCGQAFGWIFLIIVVIIIFISVRTCIRQEPPDSTPVNPPAPSPTRVITPPVPTELPEPQPIISDDDKLPVIVELSHLERNMVSGTELSVALKRSEFTEPGRYYVIVRADDYFEYQELDWLKDTFIRTLVFSIGGDTAACAGLRDGEPCEYIFDVEVSTDPPVENPNHTTPPEPPPAVVDVPDTIEPLSKSDEEINCWVTWQYQDEWSWLLQVPESLYEYYKGLPRPPTINYSVYATHPMDDECISYIVNRIEDAAERKGFSDYEKVEFALRMVQSLPYTADDITTSFDEYPRYPVETLVDNGGDCEDTSILLATIIRELGYGAVLIMFEDHCAVGVKGGDNIFGRYWEYQGDKYFYIETTDTGWDIGEVPDEYKYSLAEIMPVVPVPILTHEGTITSKGYDAGVDLKVTNLGTAPAHNVAVLAGFDAGNNKVWNASISEPLTVNVGEEEAVSLQLRMPINKYTRVLIQISIDGVLADESHGDWFFTSR